MNDNAAISAPRIARETIRELAARRLPPTPDNYARLYAELSGPEPAHGEAPGWGELLVELIHQWEIRHPGWTRARKRESLEFVARSFGSDAQKLAAKLRGLLKAWSGAGAVAGASPAAHENEAFAMLRDLSADLLALASRDGTVQHCGGTGVELAAQLRAARDPAELVALAPAVRRHMQDALHAWSAQHDKVEGLLRLLHAMVSNVENLVPDERWVKRHVERLRGILSRPLDAGSLGEAERAFREVMTRQSGLNKSLEEAKTALKDLMTSFIDRLGAMSASAGAYHSRIEGYAERIRKADDIGQLSDMVKTLLADTHDVQAELVRNKGELASARGKAMTFEKRIQELEQDLVDATTLLREDPLTGVLNRRGLDEACSVEVARSQRAGRPLCLALLDVDNFKRVNDRHGHLVGDRALHHLASIIRSTVRPTDLIARYGGEEFVILLPDTELEEAVQVMVRVQRQLTREIFLAGNERLLITFSAGVALCPAGENAQSQALACADAALYRAKHGGKNRVEAAQAG
jgi:diguanylate cyclase